MNPILLKPNSDCGSQVVLNGRVWQNLSARAYYEQFPLLLKTVLDAYERLSSKFDFVVIEGAGSVAELNLKARDLVNFGLARRINAPALLVGDVDRGGIFASIIGTINLLDEDERALVRSFAVNRFRGDPSLFVDGVQILEDRTSRSCLGVFPMTERTLVDAEDGVSLEEIQAKGGTDVAILRLPRISNLTDFRLVDRPTWIAEPRQQQFRTIILPGTKSTIADLRWMRARGLDEWVLRQHRAGARVVGICGGYQMMGRSIEDPHGCEGPPEKVDGLRLLPVDTVLALDKITVRVDAQLPNGTKFSAYEIHMGRTDRFVSAEPFAILQSGPEGIRKDSCMGTYLHGALENPAVYRDVVGVEPRAIPDKRQDYEALADWFEQNANIKLFEEMYL
jgi:adenosylcobyric acid synthase